VTRNSFLSTSALQASGKKSLFGFFFLPWPKILRKRGSPPWRRGGPVFPFSVKGREFRFLSVPRDGPFYVGFVFGKEQKKTPPPPWSAASPKGGFLFWGGFVSVGFSRVFFSLVSFFQGVYGNLQKQFPSLYKRFWLGLDRGPHTP